ncbi:MAG TPA: hypothetical protein VGJ20_30005 [Xanthobacteraceae bacterium]|jgi:general secretion pathway protein N
MKRRDRARLAAVVIAIWPSLAPAAEADHASLEAAANPLAALSLDHLRATRDRPLFAPTRRPPPVVAVARQVVKPVITVAPPDVVLVGIVTDQEGARAVVRSNKSGKLIRAQSGDEIEGWKVTLIEPRRLVLSHDDRSVDLALFAAPAAGTETAASGTGPSSAGIAPAATRQLTFRRTGH